MKYDGRFVLSTGRTFGAWTDNLSLNFNGDIAYGYDAQIYEWNEPEDPEDKERVPLTPAERREVADWVIERWQRWAADPNACEEQSND